MAIIEVRGLTKEFRVHRSRPGLGGAMRDLFQREYTLLRAVDAVDMTISAGEVVGYIGANGAGKSTTIKMLTGILVPSAGELSVAGMVPYKERERFVRNIGVVFGQRSQLWWDIAVRESFRLLQRIYRVSDEDYNKKFGEILDVMEIHELLNVPVRKLSLGQRMRCELAAALLHNPRILFLDEPTIGLDVVVKLRIRDFLRQVNERNGTTILLTTHDLADIEALCSRVIMIDKGRVMYDGSLTELRDRWADTRTTRVTFVRPVAKPDLQERLRSLPIRVRAENDLIYRLEMPRDLALSTVIQALTPALQIADLGTEETAMEEIVRAMYEGGSADVARWS